VAELQVLIGAWHASPTFALLAGLGIVVGVAYTLRVIQKAFFSEQEIPSDGLATHHEFDPISIPERLGAVLLLGTSLAIGLYPRLLLDLIVPSLNSTLFDGLRQTGCL